MDPWQPRPACVNSTTGGGEGDDDGLITNPVDLAIHRNQEQQRSDNNQEETTETTNINQITSAEDQEHQNSTSKADLSFGDNFQPFVKLPDSQQYLESLEKKLKVIQKGGTKGPNANSILQSLGQTKESCMIKLLSNSVEKLTVEGEIFEELKVNPLLKKLAPEKQALSAEELVHLLKADQLEIILSNNNPDEELQLATASEVTSSASASSDSKSEEIPRSKSPEEVSSEKDRDSTEDLTTDNCNN